MVLRTKMSPADACALSTRNNMADKAPSKFTVHGRLAQFQNDIKAQNAEIAKLRNEMANACALSTRNNMADKAPSKFTVHGRLAQFQNDIKAQNAEIAKLRNEM